LLKDGAIVDSKPEVSVSTNAPESARYRKAVGLWIRRCHLYLGLFLAPWAFLYGITGYLFNHPTHFSDRGLKEISSATLRESGFDGSLPDPHAAALEVIEKLKTRFPDSPLILATEPDAKYQGDFFFATANGTEKTYQLLIRRDGGGGTYLDSTVIPKAAGPIANFTISPGSGAASEAANDKLVGDTATPEPLRIQRGAASAIEVILPQVAKKLDLPGLDRPFRLTSAPQLQFRAICQGNHWYVKYDSLKGAVSAEWIDPSSEEEPIPWRSYLLRLHTTHGYSGIYEARWFWAMLVDAMSFVLIFWGVSGFWMWWQIKRLRAVGSGVIAVSLLVAISLLWGLAKG